MSERIKMTMPVADDQAAEKNSFSTPATDTFKPWPESAGTSFTNKLFIPLMAPANWRLFNPDESTVKRLGMSKANPLRHPGDPELYTFYFKVATHRVDKFVRADGSIGFASVVCPVKLNYFLEKHIHRKPLFISPRCPFCEAESEAWSEHNARWAELNIDKRNLSKEGYKAQVDNDPILKETRERAYNLKAFDKILINVFDYSRFIGDRTLDAGSNHGYQTWFAPKIVLDSLIAMDAEADKDGVPPFHDFYNPQGLQIVNVSKNTEKCTPGNFRDTSYTCFPGPVKKFEQGWMDYLTHLGSTQDPSGSLIVLPYEEASVYAGNSYSAPVSYNSAPVAPVVAAPVVPVAPVVAAPVAPVVAAPVAPSAPVAPVAPSAPVAPAVAAPAASVGPPPPNSVPLAQAPSAPSVPVPPIIPAVGDTPDRSEGGEATSDYPDGITW